MSDGLVAIALRFSGSLLQALLKDYSVAVAARRDPKVAKDKRDSIVRCD